ncbi:hypothetical protein F5146DRAFT_1122049 [Armillaria mellea]|nr:hypothetical protein F5146DRAFT_1122049 [Armillaria mellea]
MPRRDSLTPQSITSVSRLHVYCLPSWSHFRLVIVGAFAAYVLIYVLCLPFSSTSYCSSASWMGRKLLTSSSTKNSSKQHSCFTEGNCITTADSAAILSFHLGHINFMVDLVEGTGLPPGRHFDFGGRLLIDTGKYMIYDDAEVDEDHRVFMHTLYTLCEFRYEIKRRYRYYLVDNFFKSFGPWGMSPVLNPFNAAIKSLRRATEQEALMETSSPRLQEKYAIKVDNILRHSLDRLFTDIRAAFTELSAGVPPIMELLLELLVAVRAVGINRLRTRLNELLFSFPPVLEIRQLFANCSSYGHLVSEGLVIEIPRVEEAYRNLPWWESVPVLDLLIESILGIKPRRWAISSYKEFLSRDKASIRILVEHASILHAISQLSRVILFGMRIIQQRTKAPLTADELAQLVVDVKGRLDHDYYGDNLDIPPRRRIGSHLSLPFNEDSFVDESVDLDGNVPST